MKAPVNCTKCRERPALHTRGKEFFCCECYVADGYPPADWHPACMQAFQTLKGTKTRDWGTTPERDIEALKDRIALNKLLGRTNIEVEIDRAERIVALLKAEKEQNA